MVFACSIYLSLSASSLLLFPKYTLRSSTSFCNFKAYCSLALWDPCSSIFSLSVSFNYFSNEKQQDPEAPKIATYAYGEDYHHVVKDRLKSLLQYMQAEIGEVNGRCFVDSAPVMEREWAQRAGIEQQGRVQGREGVGDADERQRMTLAPSRRHVERRAELRVRAGIV